MKTLRGFSSRGATNALLATICALLALQLLAAHADIFLPRRLLAATVRSAARSADAPQPVYLVGGPSGGKFDMLPVNLVYLDKSGLLSDAVAPDGSVRVRVLPGEEPGPVPAKH